MTTNCLQSQMEKSLSIPPNVRIMFEVESLKYATLVTALRWGIVWFSQEVVCLEMMYFHYLERLKQVNYDLLIREDAVESTDEDASKKAQSSFEVDN